MGILERRLREKALRKRSILKSARQSFLENGLEAASVQNIAQRAELSKAAIYLYFKDKTAILEEILGQTLEKLDCLMCEIQQEESSGLELLKSWGKAYTRLCLEHPDDFFFIQLIDVFAIPMEDLAKSETEGGKRTLRFVEKIKLAFQKGIDDGSLRADLDSKKTTILVSQVFSGFMKQLAALRDQVKQNTGYGPEELIEHLFDILISGIGNKTGEKYE